MNIDLLWLSETQDLPIWSFGKLWCVSPTPIEVSSCVEKNLPCSQADAWLFWDSSQRVPDPDTIIKLLSTPDKNKLLIIASERGDLKLVKLLLDHGADIHTLYEKPLKIARVQKLTINYDMIFIYQNLIC